MEDGLTLEEVNSEILRELESLAEELFLDVAWIKVRVRTWAEAGEDNSNQTNCLTECQWVV